MSSVSDRTLHCLSCALQSSAARRLLAQLEAGDPVLLLGEAVVLAGVSHPDVDAWITTGARIHALKEDLLAYAVTQLHPSIIAADYADWVALSEQHQTQTLWR